MGFDFKETHNVTDAVIYCRVSSKAQVARGDGLQSQETRCRAYADYKGYEIEKVFTDDLTGQRADRPGLSALLSYLTADRRNPKVVIIDDITRFARRVPIHFELRAAIAEAGGILESPSVELRDDADGELHEYILASVSQHQSRKNAEQTLNRMQARCLNGYWVFRAPTGYRHEKVKGHGKLLVRDEPKASILQEALEGFASGRFETQVEVKRFLEAQPDFPKDLPNGEIRNQRITDYLTAVIYAGYMEVPNWNIPLREAKHEGLIDLATFERIQERLRGKAKAPIRKDIRADFPLRGFVVCADCDKPLTACWSKSSTDKQYPYYLCFTKGCESYRKSIPRNRLEGDFAKLLKSLQPTGSLYRVARALFASAWDQRAQQSDLARQTLKKEIAKAERQIEQLVDRIVESDSTTATKAYENRIAKLEKEKLVAQEKLSQDRPNRDTFEQLFELACGFLANPCKLWENGRLDLKKIVLRLVFAEPLAYCRERGLRTPKTTLPFKVLAAIQGDKMAMARPGRFELPTS